jgi:hypothetical protein
MPKGISDAPPTHIRSLAGADTRCGGMVDREMTTFRKIVFIIWFYAWFVAMLVSIIGIFVSLEDRNWTEGSFWMLATYFLTKLGHVGPFGSGNSDNKERDR